jgi:hypothetical protein
MTKNKAKPRKAKTYVELGEIMLATCGSASCQKGYGTTDPEWVGRYALDYCDINKDGTLN